MSCPDDLRRLYRDGRIIPFIGAGASMAVNWKVKGLDKSGPSWRDLVDQACIQLGVTEPALLRMRGTDLQILEFFRVLKGGFAPLTNWLSISFSSATEADILSCSIHKELCALEKCKVLYTTNYDDFLERAFRATGRQVQVVTSELSINHQRDFDEIIKFHGDFNYPEGMVLSESHYLERMKFESPMDFRLRADILGRAVLFIGYSFNDQNVSYIFHLVNKLFQALPDSYTGRRAYIVLIEPSEFERRLFHLRNIEVIGVSSIDTQKQIGDLLREMSA